MCDDVVAVVYEEFQYWFGPDDAGDKERYRSIAEEIWRLWNNATLTRPNSTHETS